MHKLVSNTAEHSICLVSCQGLLIILPFSFISERHQLNDMSMYHVIELGNLSFKTSTHNKTIGRKKSTIYLITNLQCIVGT